MVFLVLALSCFLLRSISLNRFEFSLYFSFSSTFLVKQIIVLVIILNGTFLNLFISPKLINISFGEPHVHKEHELNYLRRLAFALGAISITSWYSVFILGSLHSVTLKFGEILGIYLVVIFVAVIFSQVFESLISKRKI